MRRPLPPPTPICSCGARAQQDRCDVCGMSQRLDSIRRTSRMIAESPAMQAVLKKASLIAAADAPVIILGESGSGKEVVARALHTNSPRVSKPFLAVNVAALPAELLESELFGHARGAFTGAGAAKVGLLEAASGGTLFLDEVAEMPLALQVKLLRALQDGEVRRVGDTRAFAVDVRFVCATHRNLAEQIERGLFRQDLYYRLKVFTVRVPPLRERLEDILPLAMLFLQQEHRGASHFSHAAQLALVSYLWPGNVRELGNAVQHGAALSPGPEVDVEHLPDELQAPSPSPSLAQPPSSAALRPLAEIEREYVLHVLDACGGSQAEAARILGIGRNTLWRRLRRWSPAP